MLISRIVIKNYRSLKEIDVSISEATTCIVGENNTGKSNLVDALRVCLDVNLAASFRSLQKEDIHCSVDINGPFQVLIGIEFSGFSGAINEEAMLLGTQIAADRARIFYRYRPKRDVRDALKSGETPTLTLLDYSWELMGGGNPSVDLADIEWDTENEQIGASSVSFQNLQSYLVVYLHALRDVETDLQQLRKSPLAKLIDACGINETEQQSLIDALQAANDIIENSPTIKAISSAIDDAFEEVTGPAYNLKVDLGLAPPTFQAILRNIKVLLSSAIQQEFEPRRNGLGMNNILYMAILIEYFRKRAGLGRSSGELILLEEPEAHLHPQLQATFLDALQGLPFQIILTTHSTQITSKARLASYVLMTNKANGEPYAASPVVDARLAQSEADDLERYLDATKSDLLFARKVMLVEGIAEVFLIPPLVKQIMGVDLARMGVSVIAVHGTHFEAFSKLFKGECLPKKCAIVADADVAAPELDVPSDEDVIQGRDYSELEGEYLKVFLGETTFEKELTTNGNLEMFRRAAEALSAPKIAKKLEIAELLGADDETKEMVLRTAKRFGKGRFAQMSAKYSSEATELPLYIRHAVEWLLSDDSNN